jgi:DNA topoisomerase IB
LRIPPAWTEVAVSRNPRARLLAIGRDKKGRWQYVYSQAAVREREQRKYEKLTPSGVPFLGCAAPSIVACACAACRTSG